MQKKLVLLLILLTAQLSLRAQEIYGNNDLWTQFNLVHNFEKPLQLGCEFHYRLNDWVKNEQFLIRPFLTYHRNPSVDYTLGYTYVKTYPYDKYPLPSDRIEHNIWEQVTLKQDINKLKALHRFRWEQRLVSTLNDQGNFDFGENRWIQRWRYRLTLQFPLYKKLSADFFEEIFVTSIPDRRGISLDRNWIHLGLRNPLLEHHALSLGYLYQYNMITPDLIERHHGIQLLWVWTI